MRKKNVPSANWSKFLYIFYRHHFNFETKWDFCVKSKSWSYEDRGYFFRFCANVCRAVTMRRQRNHHYLKWIQSSLEGRKNLICCRLFTSSKKKKNPSCTNSRKELRRNCSPIGHNNTKHFCAQSGAGICLNFWNSSVRVGSRGALLPVLENFRPAFSPDPTDCPWISEDAWRPDNWNPGGRVVQSRVKITMVRAKFEFRYESLKSKFSFTLFPCNLMIGCSKKNRENNPIKCFWTKEKETQVKI